MFTQPLGVRMGQAFYIVPPQESIHYL